MRCVCREEKYNTFNGEMVILVYTNSAKLLLSVIRQIQMASHRFRGIRKVQLTQLQTLSI